MRVLGSRRLRAADAALLAGLAVLALLVLVDVLSGVILSGTYAAGVVVCATAAPPRRTAVIGLISVALGAASGLWHDTVGTPGWGLRLLANVVVCSAAVSVAAVGFELRTRLMSMTTMIQELIDSLAGELIGARTVKAVSRAFVAKAADSIGADQIRVHILDQDKALRPLAWYGKEPTLEVVPGSDHPKARVAATGVPLHLRDEADLAAHFPDLVHRSDVRSRGRRSVHVLPLMKAGVVEGVLTLSFPPGRAMPRSQDPFLVSISGALGEAIHRAAELEREDLATARMQLLHEASATFTRSLDVDTTIEEVARLLVPRFADWCAIQLERDGVLEMVALRHSDPARTTWGREVADAVLRNEEGAPFGARAVLESGRSELYPFIPIGLLSDAATSEEHLTLLHRFGMRSAMVVPLLGRSGPIGTVTLVQAESGRTYADEDVAFLEQLAGLAAQALETAVTFQDQSAQLANMTEVAEAAQQAILAPPPDRAGPLRLAARYRGAAAAAQIGGDLFEVVPLEGRTRLLIGDVRGKGLDAVRTATIVLGEFRAAATADGDLRDLARTIDAGIRPYLQDEDFVTACLLEIRADGGFSVASCGHPAPALLSGGTVEEIAVEHAPPLGLGADPEVVHGRLGPYDRLVMFTDGLVEARTPDRDFVDHLQVLAALAAAPFDRALDIALEALEVQTEGTLADDLALLIAEYAPEG